MLLCFENPYFLTLQKSRAKIADVLPHFYWIFNVFYWFFYVLCFDHKVVAMRQKGRWAPCFRHVSIVRLEAGLAPSWTEVGGGFGGRSGAGLEAGWKHDRKQVRG